MQAWLGTRSKLPYGRRAGFIASALGSHLSETLDGPLNVDGQCDTVNAGRSLRPEAVAGLLLDCPVTRLTWARSHELPRHDCLIVIMISLICMQKIHFNGTPSFRVRSVNLPSVCFAQRFHLCTGKTKTLSSAMVTGKKGLNRQNFAVGLDYF